MTKLAPRNEKLGNQNNSAWDPFAVLHKPTNCCLYIETCFSPTTVGIFENDKERNTGAVGDQYRNDIFAGEATAVARCEPSREWKRIKTAAERNGSREMAQETRDQSCLKLPLLIPSASWLAPLCSPNGFGSHSISEKLMAATLADIGLRPAQERRMDDSCKRRLGPTVPVGREAGRFYDTLSQQRQATLAKKGGSSLDRWMSSTDSPTSFNPREPEQLLRLLPPRRASCSSLLCAHHLQMR